MKCHPHMHNGATTIVLLTLTLLLSYACDSQKRVTAALLKLERSEDYKKTRSWPQNYTFGQYSDQLDDAKLRKAFYEKRKTQAFIARDKKTVDVMQDNIKAYDKTIERLKKDKKFYKIYKLRSKNVQLKIKEENKTKHALEKQKLKLDKKEMRANKAKLKERKLATKEQQRIIDNKRKELRKRKSIAEKSKNEHAKKIEERRKEIKRLEKLKTKVPVEAQSSYSSQIQFLQREIKVLQGESKTYDAPIESLEKEIALPDSVLQIRVQPKQSVE